MRLHKKSLFAESCSDEESASGWLMCKQTRLYEVDDDDDDGEEELWKQSSDPWMFTMLLSSFAD